MQPKLSPLPCGCVFSLVLSALWFGLAFRSDGLRKADAEGFAETRRTQFQAALC